MPGMFRVRAEYTTTKTQIICRTVSDKRHKIIAEVRLIVVAALLCDPRPIDWLGGVNPVQGVVQPF